MTSFEISFQNLLSSIEDNELKEETYEKTLDLASHIKYLLNLVLSNNKSNENVEKIGEISNQIIEKSVKERLLNFIFSPPQFVSC